MCAARAVVIPSTCYEMFPVVAAEAFAAGTPVVASAHGGLKSIVEDGHTGRLFTPGDAAALASTLDALHADSSAVAMGVAARRRYETAYSPSANYQQLNAIYDSVIGAGAVRSA